MVRLKTASGVEVSASDASAEYLLRRGYKLVESEDKEPKEAASAKSTRKPRAKKEETPAEVEEES